MGLAGQAGATDAKFMGMKYDTQEDDNLGDELEVELTEQEFHYAIKMTDVSIRLLTKQHIINLRKQVKP